MRQPGCICELDKNDIPVVPNYGMCPVHKVQVKYDAWHVFPQNDEKPHEFTSTLDDGLYCPCKCAPIIIEKENGAFIIVHNSFDGREGVEWAAEILSNP